MARRRKKSKPVGPAVPHTYIVHARCVWRDHDFGATTYSNPTIYVTSTDPAKAVEEAHAQMKAQAGRRRTLYGFQVDKITDKGPAKKEATVECTIGLL